MLQRKVNRLSNSKENSLKFIGLDGSLSVFSDGTNAVSIDTELGLLVEIGELKEVIKEKSFELVENLRFQNSVIELAELSLREISSSEAIISSASRLYTIPTNVQEEAEKALEWRKEHKRGGTPVGLNTARRLAKGGQIGIEKIRHIAKYFPRHEVDKKGKGWKPGEDNFPSNGRIAWALWGGDGARRWARAIVERENKKALKADGYPMPQLDDFKKPFEMSESIAPEFIARVRLDGSGIDRIYKIDVNGNVFVWDDGLWDDLGNIENNVWEYDSELDDPNDLSEKTHVLIDPESAIQICGKMQSSPFESIPISDFEEEEYELAVEAYEDEDWEFIDSLTAAGETPLDSTTDSTPGVYDSDERATNASKQTRDATGRFAAQGSKVTVKGGKPGVITSIDGASGNVTVKHGDGTSSIVPAKLTTQVSDSKPITSTPNPAIDPIDTSGILGEPRTPINKPQAQLPGTLPPLTSKDLNGIMNDFSGWVNGQRLADPAKKDVPLTWDQKAGNRKETPFEKADAKYKKTGETTKKIEEMTGIKVEYDPYKHPLIKNWLKQTVNKGGKTYTPNALWYQPVTGSASPSDVQPLYLAIVSPDDPRDVLHCISVVPASKTSSQPMVYAREEAKWVRRADLLADLKSATPPPVVPLTKEALNDVLVQIDGVTASAHSDYALTRMLGSERDYYEAITAASATAKGLRGARKLKKYWTVGKGGKKIRWGTGGDWTRCVRQLGKYLGPRAKGYCALRHKEMTGLWTGDKKHRQMYGWGKNAKRVFSTDLIKSSEMILESTALLASKADARTKMAMVASSLGHTKMVDADQKMLLNESFYIPLVIPEGIESGDGRKFAENVITFRELPLPLMWQVKTGEGHSNSYVVGRIDSMERVENGIGNARGVFDNSPYAQEVVRLIRNGFVRGISADMDQFEAVEEKESSDELEAKSKSKQKLIGKDKLTINKARVMGITIVAKPAFQECSIYLDSEQAQTPQEEPVIEDGIYVDDMNELDATSLVACGYVAGAIPVTPPFAWFEDPKLTQATPLTVDDDGRVYGHIAAWSVDHIGLPFGTKPPRSKSKYSYFHTGVLRTEEGKDVPVGQLTLAGGHAPLEASASEAVKHYDDTASAFADVHAGEDAYGIWVSGALRPETTPEQIRAARASAPSGDWRPIRGSLELVAVCQVNVPGFPIARARVASGAVMALVAAGARVLAEMKSDPIRELNERLERLESSQLDALSTDIDALVARVASAKSEIEEYSDFAIVSRRERKKLAEKGLALPDGSYPIRNVGDLKNAIQGYGRAKNKASAKRHIIKRARDLGKTDLIPDTWTLRASGEDLMARVASAQEKLNNFKLNDEMLEGDVDPKAPTAEEATEKPGSGVESGSRATGKYTPQTQPRDESGKFRKVLARLKQDLGTSGLQKIVEEAKTLEDLHEIGNYAEAAKAGVDLMDIIGRLDSGALNNVSLENVRNSARELGKVISNLPLGFNDQSEKVRYSDLPPALRDLMDNMIEKVYDKIEKKDADIATKELKSFKSGSDVYSQGEISSQMSKLLRLLT
jgi:hypothetical protein